VDKRRHQIGYVAFAWVLALASLATYFAGQHLGTGTEGHAPTGDDYKRGCLSILLIMASFSFAVLAGIWSLIGLFLVRSYWVIGNAVAGVAGLAPWIVMVLQDTVVRTMFR
jgi:hypothetical protein